MAFIITENCILCGTCREVCPNKSVVEYEWYYRIADTCAECGACFRVCPNTAIIKIEKKQND
jgi:MinD superfamily P-loop ATPase